MKKTLKALFALMLGAAMGSSAWAVNEVKLSIGETWPKDGSWLHFSYKGGNNERWYMINSGLGNGDTADIVRGEFQDSHPDYRNYTNGVQDPDFRFVAVAPGEVTLHLWRCNQAGTDNNRNPDLVPRDIKASSGNNYAYRTYEGYENDGNYWMDTTQSSGDADHTYHFTVVAPEFAVIEPVYVKATRVTLGTDAKTFETQYEGYQTKKGYQYVWAKDGVAIGDWSAASDGTPMELTKPAEANQLLEKLAE